MKHISLAIALVAFALTSCEQPQGPSSTNSSIAQSSGALSKGAIIHLVSVGSPDVQPPPQSDRNFTLVATMDNQGNVSGQWDDEFAGGAGRIHVAVDCLTIVSPGNRAIIGGVITYGTANGIDVSGQRAVTAVVDNGKSVQDPADRISASFFDETIQVCGTYPFNLFPLFDLTRGQVVVK